MTKYLNRTTGTIRLAFKEPLRKLVETPNQESLLMIHYSCGTLRFKYSTNYYSSYNNWDYRKQRIRNKVEILNRNEINTHLDELERALKKEVSILDANQKPVTRNGLKSCLDTLTNKNVQQAETTKVDFYEFCEIFFKRKEGNIGATTLRSYKQAVTLIKRYDKASGNQTTFDAINLGFYYNFIAFLEEDDKALNTIGKHIKSLKTILNSSLDNGVNTNAAFKSKEFKTMTEETTAIYLSADEIQKIRELDLFYDKEHQRSRDIFLMGYYTGQRVSDYNNFNIRDVYTNGGVQFIKVKQKKTGNTVDCPITVEMKYIMDNYYEGRFPKKKAEQHINQDIKAIVRKAKIKEEIKCVYTKGGKEITEWIAKYKLVGTHTSRRSFCTNHFLNGGKAYDIMHFSGHKTEREFYKYIRVREEEKSLHIAKSGLFNLAV